MPGPSPAAPIVKLGGSLFADPRLDALLAVCVRRRALVVAGGGLFADAVRSGQSRLRFGERAAHRMAILAMEQAAWLLVDRRPDFAPCATRAEMADAAASGRPAVWLPSRLGVVADVPASWETTSDSLALWLAVETGAPRLAIVKSCAVAAGATPGDWAREGVVDPVFPVLAAGFGAPIVCVGEASVDALEVALTAPEPIAA